MIQQWDFPVDEPVSLSKWRHDHLSEHVPAIALRVERGETLRAIAQKYGVSHEALRQALKRPGIATRPLPAPVSPTRRVRSHRMPGRGRSTALAPSEVTTLLARHHAGESMRSLARASGVSHETLRRAFARITTDARDVAAG